MWKCPSCSYKSQSYSAVQKHYYKTHYKPSPNSTSVPKGKQKKVFTFKPKVGRRK
jgi:hypothetical protein